MGWLKWLWNYDRAWNANTAGAEGSTLSEQWARWRRDGNRFQRTWGHGACAFLNLFDRDHCTRVLAAAEKRERDATPEGPPAA